MPHPRLSSDEIADRGQELFERKIRSSLAPGARGSFLVLDVETGDYELDRDELAALQRARARRPGAPLYVVRIGYPTAYRLGRGALAAPPC